MSSDTLDPSISAWLSQILDVSPTQPSLYPSNSTESPNIEDDDVSIQHSEDTSFYKQTDSNPRHTYHFPNLFDQGPEIFPALNSTYRSTLELLESLPAPFDLMRLLPGLPTRLSTAFELSEALPHEISNPLVRCAPFSPFFDFLIFTMQRSRNQCLNATHQLRWKWYAFECSTFVNAYASKKLYRKYIQIWNDSISTRHPTWLLKYV